VGRVAGGAGDATPRAAASVSESDQATSDQAARELEGPETALVRASSRGARSPALTATSASTSHRPRWRSAPRRTEHGTFLDDATLELMAARGVFFDPNFLVLHNYLENKPKFLGIGNYNEEGF